MKKLLLLLASGSIALSGYAQMRSVDFSYQGMPSNRMKAELIKRVDAPKTSKKTTATSRTYSYYQVFDTLANDVSGIQTGFTSYTMWQDSAQLGGFSSGYDNITNVSCGAILHPQQDQFNNPTYYDGAMKITNTDAYTVKSVRLYGVYDFNPANTWVDTLVLVFNTGKAGDPPAAGNDLYKNGRVSGGHYGSWGVVSMRYDTVLNRAKNWSGPQGTPIAETWKIPMGPSSFGDTDVNGLWTKEITLGSSGLSVGAGEQVGMSISFISGQPTMPANDTIFYSDGTFKYNMFRPLIMFASTDGTSAGVDWAPFDSTNFNEGLYKSLPHNDNGWDFTYLPQWAYFAIAGGASVLQHPVIDWNIECPTCGDVTVGVANAEPISKVNAYPNPAGDVLNVPFTLATATDVTVTLTNVLGQVVASQEMGNVATGTAKFNTISLPAGVYTYSVLANGQRSTGRVAIAH